MGMRLGGIIKVGEGLTISWGTCAGGEGDGLGVLLALSPNNCDSFTVLGRFFLTFSCSGFFTSCVSEEIGTINNNP